MKIRPLTPENFPKVVALLRQAFSTRTYEMQLVEKLHHNSREMHEWVCIHCNMIIAYIAFTKAFDGAKVCGLHLALLAVKPQMQHQGTGSALLRFALRQEIIKDKPVFVLGAPDFFQRFGFERCAQPLSALATNKAPLLSIRNDPSHPYTVGYDPEFKSGR